MNIEAIRKLIVEQADDDSKPSVIARLILSTAAPDMHKLDQIKLVTKTLDVGMRAGARLAGWHELGGTLNDNEFDELMQHIACDAISRLRARDDAKPNK